ncbi:hypothetical protein [Prevotella sp.]|uniref:hypothetical protein n=1 Tax=Prevotella sp. TaxID=59823 RepID=UPI003AB59061
MRLSKLFLAICFCLVFGTKADAQKTIYGANLYSESEDMAPGIYSFTDTPDSKLTCVYTDGDLRPNAGAVYANGKYYAVSYMDMGFMTIAYMLVYDMSSYTMQDMVMIEDWNVSYVSSDMTYDPSTGNIYACSLNADGSGNFNLSLFDTNTAKQTPIAPIERMCALAAAPDGTLYGIGAADGVLYKIDKTNAELTEVGPTGVQPENNQSATIDEDTGVMYWSAYTKDGGALYTVDTTTGQANKVFSYPDMTQIVGIYTLKAEHNEPAAPTEVSLNFDGGSLNGTMDFNMPVNNFDEKPLTDEKLNYDLTIDIDKKISGSAAPGEKVSVPLSFDEEGNHIFSLTVSNDAGTSEAVNMTRYIGFDTPKPVTDMKIAKDDNNKITLTWNQPESGVNEGYVDLDNLTYKIVRQPDNVVVDDKFKGTEFSEALTPEEKRICYYEVSAMAADKSSDSTISNYVILGEHYLLPVDDDLTDWTRYPLYTVIDANGDKATWRYDLGTESIMYEWAYGDGNDDWLITPSIYMEAGKQYVITASLRNEAENVNTGIIEYAVGKDDTAAAMNTITDNITIKSADFEDYKSDKFSVSEDGYYNVGIHIKGDDSMYYVYINRLMINEDTSTGISDANAGNSNISLSRNGATVTISNPDGLAIYIFNASGQCVGKSSSTHIEMQLGKGMYIMKSARGNKKFIM